MSKEDETCPVCLKRLKSYRTFRELGRPSSCDHLFCFMCIFSWSKVGRIDEPGSYTFWVEVGLWT